MFRVNLRLKRRLRRKHKQVLPCTGGWQDGPCDSNAVQSPGVVCGLIMPLNRYISELLHVFRSAEASDSRGPRFKDVALAIEREMRAQGVSEDTVIECFGPPDLWGTNEDRGLFVYFFDHELPGRNADEWYFHLTDGKLSDSAYNRRGINDFSTLKSIKDWPQKET